MSLRYCREREICSMRYTMFHFSAQFSWYVTFFLGILTVWFNWSFSFAHFLFEIKTSSFIGSARQIVQALSARLPIFLKELHLWGKTAVKMLIVARMQVYVGRSIACENYDPYRPMMKLRQFIMELGAHLCHEIHLPHIFAHISSLFLAHIYLISTFS